MAQKSIETTKRFLQLTFRDYYSSNRDLIDVPDKTFSREFAIQSWEYIWSCKRSKDERGQEVQKCRGTSFIRLEKCPSCGSGEINSTDWHRHLAFHSRSALFNGLVTRAPHSVYHSAAFYEAPDARMNQKGWQGAELVFDIDADHLELECAKNHDSWVCKNKDCVKTGKGMAPEVCPDCGENSFRTMKWICDSCLGEAKKNTLKLHDDFLLEDFGFDPESIQINYSGHRGYHVRVKDPKIYNLDSRSRVELVHYITGLGFNSQRAISSTANVTVVTDRSVPGWAGKIADAMIEFIRSIDDYNGKQRWVKNLQNHRVEAITGLQRNPPVLSSRVKGIGIKFWQEIAEVSAERYGVDIDVPVTHDVHRVIRLIGSLNGKTGFIVKNLSRDQIVDFEPFTDALFLTGKELKIRIKPMPIDIPRFKIESEIYGPYHDEVITIPKAAAVFLLCKGVALIEQDDI